VRVSTAAPRAGLHDRREVAPPAAAGSWWITLPRLAMSRTSTFITGFPIRLDLIELSRHGLCGEEFLPPFGRRARGSVRTVKQSTPGGGPTAGRSTTAIAHRQQILHQGELGQSRGSCMAEAEDGARRKNVLLESSQFAAFGTLGCSEDCVSFPAGPVRRPELPTNPARIRQCRRSHSRVVRGSRELRSCVQNPSPFRPRPRNQRSRSKRRRSLRFNP